MPYRIIDNFAPPALVRGLTATWLPADSGHWHYSNGKRVTKDASQLPQAAVMLLHHMALWVPDKTWKVENAFPDIEFLHGAGLSDMEVGSELGLHTDADYHPTLPWRREMSTILYLNDCQGGDLVLHGAGDTVVSPVENRFVAFTTRGQPHRVTRCGTPRKAICLFWWSVVDATEINELRAASSTRATFIATNAD